VLGDHAVDLAGNLLELPGAALADEHEQEVPEQLLPALEQVLERGALAARVELRVAQELAELRDRLLRLDELLELLAHRLQPVLVARRVEQGARVDAVHDAHSFRSSTEKSRSPIASSIRRRWSASSSDLRVTFSAAIRLRSATSSRICSSARRVSASLCLRVSSSRRCRSTSVSSRMRLTFASETRRASARISSASPLAWPISCRCSSSSWCASSRALSASSSDWRIRSRRWSIAFWIGANAYRLSTKSVIRKQMIVQIISPGVTWISGFVASGIRAPQTRT